VVYPQRETRVPAAEAMRQGLLVLRHHHEVNVVSHQAVRPNPYAMPLGILTYKSEVRLPKTVVIENPRPAVPALGHVMRKTRTNNSCQARHAAPIYPAAMRGQS